jgi:UDP-N-acetylmuramoyl-tripeptide--D-alanyl-D-alanine ligase
VSKALFEAYQVAAATGGELYGGEDWQMSGLSIDTRTIRKGDLFVALSAERDGHDFAQQAFQGGAAAALVSKPVEGGPYVLVPDTLKALERLAEAARDRCFSPLIGVTGSAGKTTTKEMLRAALTPLGEVHAAQKSFNNHIGVPLTLAELPPAVGAGVFEMGMNHAGEIRGLTSLVRPHIALITTIAEAHLEFLGSMEAIADAKAEIAEGLRPSGAMILPGDSPYLSRLKQRCEEAGVRNLLTFGWKGEHGWLKSAEDGAEGQLVEADILGQPVRFRLAAQGAHMATNALAALLAAVEAGVSAEAAAAALESFSTGAGRGERYKLELPGGRTILVLDESYNANPASMRASLGVLAKETGRKVAVLGEMKELGETSPQLHADLADAAAVADIVYTAGPAMEHLRRALPEAKRGTHCENAIDLLQPLLDNLHEASTVLFKGSNASRVGALLGALLKAGRKV